MSVQLLIDMNLSVEWVAELASHGWSTVHWFTVGDPTADDVQIMAWALANGYVVFTHDLDFGTMLALTHATGPSVLQVRGQNVLPEDIGTVVIAALRRYDAELAAGALVVVDVTKSRVRVRCDKIPRSRTAAVGIAPISSY
jgi:predicted nuclease of predicted toxin-antitoxin system